MSFKMKKNPNIQYGPSIHPNQPKIFFKIMKLYIEDHKIVEK